MNQEIHHQEHFFHGQQPDEEIVCFFRRHWVTFFPHILSMAAFLIATFLLFFAIPFLYKSLAVGIFKILFLLTVTLSLAFIHYFFLKAVHHFLTVIIVTNSRIISINKTLFLTDNTESFDLRMIQEINKNQNGFLPNLFGYGDLSITLSQSAAILQLNRIPRPDYYFRTISKAKLDHIEARIQRKIEMQNTVRENVVHSAHDSPGWQKIGTESSGGDSV